MDGIAYGDQWWRWWWWWYGEPRERLMRVVHLLYVHGWTVREGWKKRSYVKIRCLGPFQRTQVVFKTLLAAFIIIIIFFFYSSARTTPLGFEWAGSPFVSGGGDNAIYLLALHIIISRPSPQETLDALDPHATLIVIRVA
jgi:hypothetical protein